MLWRLIPRHATPCAYVRAPARGWNTCARPREDGCACTISAWLEPDRYTARTHFRTRDSRMGIRGEIMPLGHIGIGLAATTSARGAHTGHASWPPPPSHYHTAP